MRLTDTLNNIGVRVMTLIYSTYFTFAIAILFPPNRAGPEQQHLPSPRTLSRARGSPNARHTSVPETEGAHQAGVAGLRALGRPDDAREAGTCTGSGVSFPTCDAGNFDGRTMGRRLAWLNRRYRGRGVYRRSSACGASTSKPSQRRPEMYAFQRRSGMWHILAAFKQKDAAQRHIWCRTAGSATACSTSISSTRSKAFPIFRRSCSTRPCVRRGPVEEDEDRDDGGVGLGPEGDRTASADPHRDLRQRPATHLRARGVELERRAAPGTPLLSSTTTPQ